MNIPIYKKTIVPEDHKDLIKEVKVDKKFSKYIRKNPTYSGRCYETAFRYILNRPDLELKLIHGTTDYYHVGDLRAHAWVEFLDQGVEIVFDGTTQKFYDKKDYYEKGGAVKEKEYSLKEACKIFVSTKMYSLGD